MSQKLSGKASSQVEVEVEVEVDVAALCVTDEDKVCTVWMHPAVAFCYKMDVYLLSFKAVKSYICLSVSLSLPSVG